MSERPTAENDARPLRIAVPQPNGLVWEFDADSPEGRAYSAGFAAGYESRRARVRTSPPVMHLFKVSTLRRPSGHGDYAYCGAGPARTGEFERRPILMTDDFDAVTCKRCRTVMQTRVIPPEWGNHSVR